MTRHLTVEQALRIARAAVGGPIEVRDLGLLAKNDIAAVLASFVD